MKDKADVSGPIRDKTDHRRFAAMQAGTTQAFTAALFSVAVILAAFLDTAHPLLLIVWPLAMIAAFAVRWQAVGLAEPDEADADEIRRRLARITGSLIVTSTLWAVGFPLFAMEAAALQLAVLTLVGTAIFVGVLLVHRILPLAAIAHVVILAAGMLVATFLTAGTAAAPAMILVAFYAVMLCRAIVQQDRVFRQVVADEYQREEDEATIRMLLNEYEAQSLDWLWTVGPRGNLREVSVRLSAYFGQDPEELEGRQLVSMLSEGDRRDRLASLLVRRQAFRDEIVKLELDGEPRYLNMSARPRTDGRMTGVARDVTEERMTEERVQFMAHYDDLTGLANRYQFNEGLSRLLKKESGSRGKVALFLLDLDDFKAVNDTLGHLFGDRLLREVGSRLEMETRAQDLVARIGGDEFAIVLDSDGGDSKLIERAHRFLDVLREPFEVDEHTFSISTSIGIARNTEVGCEAEELMRRADLALYAAKGRGRDQVALFDDRLDREAQERRRTELELGDAMAQDQLRLHYQPVIDLDSGRTVAYEALVRWDHPTRGLLAPGAFLEVAETTGKIVELGDWVIRQALAEMARWDGDFRVAINLSPTQIRSAHLLPSIGAAIADTGFDPRRIEFEITEHVLLQQSDAAQATLSRLHDLGSSIALDDFGTGYASLSYLRDFPYDRIKIDRTFVEDLETSESARAIVSAITRLADAMGTRTTAEGVENVEQLDLLRRLGCHEAQGYLILEPTAAAQLPEVHDGEHRLPDFGSKVLDYRKAREAALRRKRKRSV